MEAPPRHRTPLPPFLTPNSSPPTFPSSLYFFVQVYPPEPWNVQAYRSAFDLDNLRLDAEGVPAVVPAVYTLRSMIVAGQCMDIGTSSFPNGLQLQLSKLGSGELWLWLPCPTLPNGNYLNVQMK